MNLRKYLEVISEKNGCILNIFLFYVKFTGHVPIVVEDLSKTLAGSHYQLVRCHWDDIALFVCYKHKDFNTNVFLRDVKDAIFTTKENHLIIVGDFNVNFIKDNTFNLPAFFSALKMERSLKYDEATTDYGTQLDCVFTNVQSLQASVWETYYSYHKGICVNW